MTRMTLRMSLHQPGIQGKPQNKQQEKALVENQPLIVGARGKDKSGKDTPKPKPKPKGSPKRDKSEVDETDDSPKKKTKRKKARKLSSSSEETEEGEKIDELPGETPTHFSSRLAGEDAARAVLVYFRSGTKWRREPV